jgi:hypothetical protein
MTFFLYSISETSTKLLCCSGFMSGGAPIESCNALAPMMRASSYFVSSIFTPKEKQQKNY